MKYTHIYAIELLIELISAINPMNRLIAGWRNKAHIQCHPSRSTVIDSCSSARRTSRRSWNRYPNSTRWFSSRKCSRIILSKIHSSRQLEIRALLRDSCREFRDLKGFPTVARIQRREIIKITRRALRSIHQQMTWLSLSHLLIKATFKILNMCLLVYIGFGIHSVLRNSGNLSPFPSSFPFCSWNLIKF